MKLIQELFEEVNRDPSEELTENENPADELVRYEFVKLLILIADVLYKKSGEV